ncbi:MAG: DNA-directed RNA polymerase subunit D, partial [Candidatus Nanohaloarchaea archaeon]
MEITITDETDDTVEFDIEDASPAFANALRRTMIGDVPTLAIETVTVTENNSGLFDEILAHRLGLL